MAIRKFSASSLTNANSKSSKLWDQETTLGTFESIATATCTGTESTIVFSNIPQNYTHLQLRCLSRSTYADNGDNVYMQLNGSSASSYAWHRLISSGATPSSGTNSGVTLGLISINAGSTATAGTFGAAIIDILDYTNTSKNRTVRGLGGYDGNGHGYNAFQSFGYFNTTAVSSILLGTSAGFAQYSHFALYGIRGA